MAYKCKHTNAECDSCGMCEEKRLEQLPICDMCDEHIQQDDAVQVDGKWFCDECLDDLRVSIMSEI